MEKPLPNSAAIVQFELLDEEALALAQFVKRCGWTDWKQNASSEEEIYLMRAAFSKLERALANEGYAPR